MTTDTQLKTNVLEELKWRPNVDAAHIGVTAKDGVVTLTGQVTHYAEKTSAEEAAKGVYGVKGLANDITVDIPGGTRHSDQDVATAALHALKWDVEVPSDNIKVVVKNGWITLTGSVDWQYQKNAAARCVRNLIGVTMVSSDIEIKPALKWLDVKNKIEDAFRRNAYLEPRGIHITTDSGTVTLSGGVDTWAERDQAVWAAWSAPGVKCVNNYLTIMP